VINKETAAGDEGAAEAEVADDGEPADSGGAADPAAQRVYLRVGTKIAILEAAQKTPEGDFIGPNTGKVIPKYGQYDTGHKPGFEWWRTQQIAREQG
jgi:hypothetical protein